MKLIVIAGPTAVGKTEYALMAAEALRGEIISADSMQIYKYMDIGSAKPTPNEMARVQHHLVDCIDPAEPFSAAAYMEMADKAISRVVEAGKQPILSGGTGLYVNALLYDMDFGVLPQQEGLREELERMAAEQGPEKLHKRLETMDSEAAARIHPNNIKKVIRAIEVVSVSGKGIPDFSKNLKRRKKYKDALLVGLTRDREELYERIDLRVDLLMEAGLVKEVKSLLEQGLTEENISMKGIGYKEIIGYLHGEYDLDEAVRLVKRNTRHYAKRQLTWFRRYEDMKWFNLSGFSNREAAFAEILSFMNANA